MIGATNIWTISGGRGEYWIVDPISERMKPHGLDATIKYEPLVEQNGKIQSKILKGLYLRREWLFTEHMPTVTIALKELGVGG